MRLGSRDLEAEQPAAVVDTWDIDKCKCTRRGMRTGYATCGRFGGFAPKPSANGQRVAASGVRVEAKLPMRRRGGRRIKKSWSTMSLLGGSLMCVTKDKTGM